MAKTKEEKALDLIVEEYTVALARFGSFKSEHDGWGKIKEELDELWDEVKKRPGTRSRDEMLTEAKQVATTAMQFMIDFCLEDDDE